ncbi:MAG: zinc ABC transporter substrate-binding protein ZnuA [Chromatiales bacterium]|nr:zinc ABC transporter substrate-binding protein ZnuA [Chromatiales bacterium]
MSYHARCISPAQIYARTRLTVVGMLMLGLLFGTAQAEASPRVVVSIAPIHSLVAGVMDGVAEPQLLIAANASPHAYSLRPSDARSLSQAELVIWVGEELESMLVKPLENLAGRARIISLAEAEGIWRLPLRSGGVWETEHQHGERDTHQHDHQHDHKHVELQTQAAGQHAHGEHGEWDSHLWLAPRNARAIVELLAEALTELDPANQARYQENALQMLARITSLEQDLSRQLTPLQDRPYIVFHDAYRYFEESFSLSPVGSVTVSPEQSPGARRITEIRQTIQQRGAVCVFSEPQFRPAVVKVVLEGSGARAGVLDPLGAALAPGVDLWFGLMQGLAGSLQGCLGEQN